MTAAETGQFLASALDALAKGDVATAEPRLAAILHADPNHAAALHYLGVVALKKGDPRTAAGLIQKSLSIAPDFAAFNNLGHSAAAMGDFDGAIACFDRSIRLKNDHPDAPFHLGTLLEAEGEHASAMKAYLRTTQLEPAHPWAHFRLGVTYGVLDYIERAVASFRRHLELQPGHVEAWGRLGAALARLKRFEEAIAASSKAVELDPASADAVNNLGWVHEAAGRLEESVALYRRAVELNPRLVTAMGNIGAFHDRRGELDTAVEWFEKARSLEPKNLNVLHTLGAIYSKTGRYAEALETAESALSVDPNDATAHGHRSLCLLSFGRYEEGFAEYEWRWRCKDFTTPTRDFDQPRWDGRSNPTGRTILVHSEQGFGDVIQFARYIPMLADRGAKIIVECPLALCGLMETLSGVWRVVPSGVRPPPFELQAPLLSLPHAFKTSATNVPATVPYFSVPEPRLAKWRDRLAQDAQQHGRASMRIGIVWRGNTKPNPRRSIPLAELAPLAAAAPGARFVSLQVGAQGEEADSPPPGMSILDLREELKDFLDSAAVLTLVDHVITIDTAAAHLAGALARPTWTLLIAAADWRWLVDRPDSPWYPSMRLYRQRAAGDWSEVVAAVASDLAKLPAR